MFGQFKNVLHIILAVFLSIPILLGPGKISMEYSCSNYINQFDFYIAESGVLGDIRIFCGKESLSRVSVDLSHIFVLIFGLRLLIGWSLVVSFWRGLYQVGGDNKIVIFTMVLLGIANLGMCFALITIWQIAPISNSKFIIGPKNWFFVFCNLSYAVMSNLLECF